MSVKLGEKVFSGMQTKVNKILKGPNIMFTSNVWEKHLQTMNQTKSILQVFPDLVRAANEREVQRKKERWDYVLSALSLPHHILALIFVFTLQLL